MDESAIEERYESLKCSHGSLIKTLLNPENQRALREGKYLEELFITAAFFADNYEDVTGEAIHADQ